MPKKGQRGLKSKKGQPEYYDELKKNVMFTLTPTAVESLDTLARSMDVSRSELVERVARGVYPILTEGQVETLGKSLTKKLPSPATS